MSDKSTEPPDPGVEEVRKEDHEIFKKGSITERTPTKVGPQTPLLTSGPLRPANNALLAMMNNVRRTSSCNNLAELNDYTENNTGISGTDLNNSLIIDQLATDRERVDKRKQSFPPAGEELKRAKINTVEPPIARAVKKVDELKKLTLAHTTTPKGIKQAILQLESIIKMVYNDWNELKCEIKELKSPKNEENRSETSTIRDKMKVNMEREEIEALISEEWPAGDYSRSTLNPRDFKGDRATIKCTLVHPEGYTEDTNYLRLANIVPEVKQISKEMLRATRTIEITKCEKTAISGLDSAEQNKMYMIHSANCSDPGTIDTGDVMTWSDAMKKAAEKWGKNQSKSLLPRIQT